MSLPGETAVLTHCVRRGDEQDRKRSGEEKHPVRRVAATWKWPATFVIAGATWSSRDTRAARDEGSRRNRHPRSRLASIGFTPRSRNIYVYAEIRIRAAEPIPVLPTRYHRQRSCGIVEALIGGCRYTSVANPSDCVRVRQKEILGSTLGMASKEIEN